MDVPAQTVAMAVAGATITTVTVIIVVVVVVVAACIFLYACISQLHKVVYHAGLDKLIMGPEITHRILFYQRVHLGLLLPASKYAAVAFLVCCVYR